MIGALVRWLPLSLALHTAALAATLLLPRETTLQPLFVDLTLSPSLVESETPPAPRSGARESPAPARRQRAAPAGREQASPPPSASRGVTSAAPVAPPPPATAPEPPTSAQTAPLPSASAPTAALPAEPKTEPVAPPAAAPPPTPPANAPATAASEAPASTSGSGVASSAGRGSIGGGREPSAGAGGRAGDVGGTSADDVANASAGGGHGGGGGEMLALAIPGDDGGAYAGYISLLRRRVQAALTYPSAARRRGLSGTVHLDISVEPTGRIADVLVVRSSSHEMLDAAALDAVRTLREVPFPPGVRPRPVRVRLPVVFELR